MQSSGYTPFSSFKKPIHGQSIGLEDKLKSKLPIVATTDQEGISGKTRNLHSVSQFHTTFQPSGYVTHKQLSDFGRQMQ